jgi:GTPase
MEKKECTIVVCGPVDAGKSSLIGVLTSGQLDNGRGLARNRVLVHPHERETGRTSHISYNPLVYSTQGTTVTLSNPKDKFSTNKTYGKISISNSNNLNVTKVINFVDLAGHEKYLKTTIFGVTGLFPDYGIVVIGANTGITKLTREHLGILLYLKIPIIITITKIDLAPKQVYQNLCNQLKKLLGRNSYGKVLYFISDSGKPNDKDSEINQSGKKDDKTSNIQPQKATTFDETDYYLNNMIGNPDIIPIISVSNKEGTNIENLHKILYNIQPRDKWTNSKTPGSVFYIDSVFMVPGIGMVVSGMNKGQSVKLKQKMYLGPFSGQFKEIQIRSIHNSLKQNIDEAPGNVQSCLAFKILNQKDEITRNMIKKGMVIIDDLSKYKNNVVKTFLARINILHHSTTIKTGYCPVIHCGPIRQAAKIDLDSIVKTNEKSENNANDLKQKNLLRSGDNRIVKFTFEFNPEFMEENMIFFFRDGTTKGVGEVLKLKDNLDETETKPIEYESINMLI